MAPSPRIMCAKNETRGKHGSQWEKKRKKRTITNRIRLSFFVNRTVYGFVSIIESFTDVLLYWFPFYFFLKTVFLIWLMVPSFNVRIFSTESSKKDLKWAFSRWRNVSEYNMFSSVPFFSFFFLIIDISTIGCRHHLHPCPPPLLGSAQDWDRCFLPELEVQGFSRCLRARWLCHCCPLKKEVLPPPKFFMDKKDKDRSKRLGTRSSQEDRTNNTPPA